VGRRSQIKIGMLVSAREGERKHARPDLRELEYVTRDAQAQLAVLVVAGHLEGRCDHAEV